MLSRQRENTTKKEKVVTVKSVDFGLPGTRKRRALKEQIETFVEGMTPLKKSNTEQDTLNKEKRDEIQKNTQSKTKEGATTKSGLSVLISVLNNFTDKEEKATSNDLIPSPVNIEIVPFDKDSPVICNTTYDVQFIDNNGFERAMKYFMNYKGWNSRFDHLQSKTKEVATTKSGVSVLISVLNNFTDKEEKATSNDLIPSPVNIEVVPFDKDSPVVVGDNVYYEDEQATTYDIKQKKELSITSFSGARQAVKSVPFDTKVLGKSSLLVPSISSCSSKDSYNHNITSISISGCHENIWVSMPSTSKSVYDPDSDVNRLLFCEETIPEFLNSEIYREMTSSQRIPHLQAMMKKLKSVYKKYKKDLSKIRKRGQRIQERERKKAEATTTI